MRYLYKITLLIFLVFLGISVSLSLYSPILLKIPLHSQMVGQASNYAILSI